MSSETETARNKIVEKGAKAALLIAIVIVSSVLVLASSPPKAQQSSKPPPTSSNPANNPLGILEISVTVVNSGNLVTVLPVSAGEPLYYLNSTTVSSDSSALLAGMPGNSTTFTVVIPPPLPPVTFTAIGVGLSQAPLHLNVTQPGQAIADTAPGLYQVFTRNEYYSMSLYAQVLPNSTTNVQVNLNQSLVPAVFTQTADLDSLGMVQPWEPVTVHVPGLLGTAPGSNIFIVYGTSSSLGCPSTCLVSYSSALAKVLQVDLRSNGTWLVVSIPNPVGVQTLQDVSVESVTSSYKVITNAA